MKYLIFSNYADAQNRSAQAWTDCGYPPGSTLYLWSITTHITDGRAALMIADSVIDAQIGLTQAEYENLLSTSERLSLVSELPSGWSEF